MTRRSWDHGGKSSRERGYGSVHRRLRAELLAREPLCRVCRAKGRTTVATIADHVLSLANGGAAHDLNNMQPVCQPCHDEKTLTEQGKRVRLEIAVDGWPIE